MELSLRAKISLVIAVLIMLIFFATQTAVVIGYFPPSFKIFGNIASPYLPNVSFNVSF